MSGHAHARPRISAAAYRASPAGRMQYRICSALLPPVCGFGFLAFVAWMLLAITCN